MTAQGRGARTSTSSGAAPRGTAPARAEASVIRGPRPPAPHGGVQSAYRLLEHRDAGARRLVAVVNAVDEQRVAHLRDRQPGLARTHEPVDVPAPAVFAVEAPALLEHPPPH